jgi:hypothetical protein
MSIEQDLRYDVAAMRTYGANMSALFKELVHGGMSRKEALEVVIALVKTLSGNVAE